MWITARNDRKVISTERRICKYSVIICLHCLSNGIVLFESEFGLVVNVYYKLRTRTNI